MSKCANREARFAKLILEYRRFAIKVLTEQFFLGNVYISRDAL